MTPLFVAEFSAVLRTLPCNQVTVSTMGDLGIYATLAISDHVNLGSVVQALRCNTSSKFALGSVHITISVVIIESIYTIPFGSAVVHFEFKFVRSAGVQTVKFNDLECRPSNSKIG